MASPTVILEVVDGPASGRVFRYLQHDLFLLGRSDSADLCLADDSHLSRNHLRIEIDPPHCVVTDLQSANGTFVNGVRIAERTLVDGDTISGGQTLIRVRIGDDGGSSELLAEFADADPPADTAVMELPPTHVGGYQLTQQLGQGTMGVVYRAMHPNSGELAAVKLLSPAVAASEKSAQAFLREAAILQQLVHKRIVRFISSGIEQGHLYLVMEYVDAVDLTSTLNALSLPSRIRIAAGLLRQILDGLDYAHDRGLVHRDIKPRNILVSRRDTALKAKLADFGLAKNFLEAGLTRFSCDNDIKGTLNYMAPEQVENSRYATPASDIFSCGATLYTLVTGLPIYNLKNSAESLEAILRQGPIPITDRIPEAPHELIHVLNRAMAADPSMRFQSAADMRRALNFLAGKQSDEG
jgi:serine/threonine protein kinase